MSYCDKINTSYSPRQGMSIKDAKCLLSDDVNVRHMALTNRRAFGSEPAASFEGHEFPTRVNRKGLSNYLSLPCGEPKKYSVELQTVISSTCIY